MGYIDSQLLPGERVVYRSRLHWQVFMGPSVVGALFVLIGGGIMSQGAREAGLIIIAMAVFILIVPFIKRANSEFSVTDKRIVVKLGFVSTRTVELLHSKVEAISVNQSLLGKMLNYGDIMVTGSGGTKEFFQAVAAPLDLRRAVQAASTSAQTTP